MMLRKWLFSDSLHCLTRAGSVLGMGPADRPFLWPPLAGGGLVLLYHRLFL